MSVPSTPASDPPMRIGGETMGTRWSVVMPADAALDLHAMHAAIQATLDQVVAQMSTWLPDSDISRYNRAAAGTWHSLPEEFHRVLTCALDIAHLSDGAFDPTVGALVDLWGFGPARRSAVTPRMDERDALHARSGWQRVRLRHAPAPAALQPGGLQLDLSAIAKGFGVDQVARLLRARGQHDALVEVGGELAGFGHNARGDRWRVLVEASPDATLEEAEPRVIELDGDAIATSGDHWHHFEHEGQRYSHTMDPRTGAPVAAAATAVTVIARDAMHADAWATALTVLGSEAGMALAQSQGLAARFVAQSADGLAETMTDGFRARLVE